jgi:hypothetical protein
MFSIYTSPLDIYILHIGVYTQYENYTKPNMGSTHMCNLHPNLASTHKAISKKLWEVHKKHKSGKGHTNVESIFSE